MSPNRNDFPLGSYENPYPVGYRIRQDRPDTRRERLRRRVSRLAFSGTPVLWRLADWVLLIFWRAKPAVIHRGDGPY